MLKQIGTVAAFGALFSTAHAADITGTITLKGTPPAERVLPLDPQCAKTWPADAKPTTRFYEVSPAGGLKDTVVYLERSGDSKGASAEPMILDQVNCEYVPYVAAAMTGQTIRVKNSDPLLHNVHPTPAPGSRNKEANKVQMPKGADLDFVFPDPEMFLRFKCDVHPWMFSYVSIFDHPHFAVTDKDGKFTIKNVPAGKYTLKVNHRRIDQKPSTEIEVGDSGVVKDFTLEIK